MYWILLTTKQQHANFGKNKLTQQTLENKMNNTLLAIQRLKPFVKTVSGKTAEKAIIDMSRSLTAALSEAEIEVEEYLNDYSADNIFNPTCLLGNHDDIFSFVSDKYKSFARIMFEMRPVGLGTPNAMVGEGEFMALFCSPRVGISKKKNSGDLTVDSKTIELKGTQLRFFSPMKTTGKQVQSHAAKIAPKYKIRPNLSKGNRTAYEPWDNGRSKKLNKGDHWIAQFDAIGEATSKKFLAELCSVFMDCTENDFDVCFINGKFDSDKLQLLIVSKFFKGMEKKWDAFTQINNSKITCITDDQDEFDKLIRNDKLKMDGNYFRSFQDITVGLYVKLC
jgi:hypothetical protein